MDGLRTSSSCVLHNYIQCILPSILEGVGFARTVHGAPLGLQSTWIPPSQGPGMWAVWKVDVGIVRKRVDRAKLVSFLGSSQSPGGYHLPSDVHVNSEVPRTSNTKKPVHSRVSLGKGRQRIRRESQLHEDSVTDNAAQLSPDSGCGVCTRVTDHSTGIWVSRRNRVLALLPGQAHVSGGSWADYRASGKASPLYTMARCHVPICINSFAKSIKRASWGCCVCSLRVCMRSLQIVLNWAL